MEIVKLAPVSGDPSIPAEVKRLDFRCPDGFEDWALLKPGKREGLWVVVIHGHGSAADQLYTREDIRRLWLSRFLESEVGVLTLNVRGNSWMGPAAAEDTRSVLAYMRAEWGLTQAVFCSGSMGGTSNLIYAALHPEDVQALVLRGAAVDIGSYHDWCLTRPLPIHAAIAAAIRANYGGTAAERPALFARHSALGNRWRLDMPIHFSHGELDVLMSVQAARGFARAMTDKADFVFKEIPGGDHDSPLHETEGWDWALARL